MESPKRVHDFEFIGRILDKICKTLGTDYGDIMEYMPENEK